MHIASSVANYLAWACLAMAALLGANAIYIYNFGFPTELDEATRNALAAETGLDFFVSSIACLLATAALAVVCRLLVARRAR
ncbi:protein of unknown function [Hyphomicrobium sp. 1Nfss2.1]|uniref:hypothetical protein n=1 Tax=Hyphomicrobium sp. 1Nfss2.1 TaxID=3413936 RepID=UPI003C7B6521